MDRESIWRVNCFADDDGLIGDRGWMDQVVVSLPEMEKRVFIYKRVENESVLPIPLGKVEEKTHIWGER